MKCKSIIVTSFVFLYFFLSSIKVVGQIDPQYSQYMFVNSSFNPGSTGIDDKTDLALFVRYQWAGYNSSRTSSDIDGSPFTQLFIANTKLKFLNSGIGAFVMNERLGPISNFNAKVNYSYHLNIGNGILGLGLGLGIYNQNIDVLRFRPNDLNDPTITYLARNPSSLMLDVNAGVFYKSEKFNFGVSSLHLNTPYYNDSTRAIISRQFYLNSSYIISLNENLKIVPSLLVKSNIVYLQQSSFDLTGLVRYMNDGFWAGLSYRSGIFKPDALIAILGLGLTRNNSLKVGYAFDLTVLGNTAKAGTSHEFMLTYSKPVQDILPKPIIRTPRYRF